MTIAPPSAGGDARVPDQAERPAMRNPYRDLPDSAYWRRAVAAPARDAIDPVTAVPFRITPESRVATAGSCFAQHISRELSGAGYHVVIEEPEAADPVDTPAWRAFSAAFGNLYTARQLLQLFERAYGVFVPEDQAWLRSDGRYVDPFRPLIVRAGFDSPAAVAAARETHFDAVRRVFDRCDLFIFTLGLTESWMAEGDGAVFPIAPGVEAAPAHDRYRFHNFTVDETVADMRRFFALLRTVNPAARIILTVSPVPLIATYAPRHVLVSTIASKAILRAAADLLAAPEDGIDYFPSYEIITGPQSRGAFFAEDLRSVTAEGVATVMRTFRRHYLAAEGPGIMAVAEDRDAEADAVALAIALRRQQEFAAVICDEEILDMGRG